MAREIAFDWGSPADPIEMTDTRKAAAVPPAVCKPIPSSDDDAGESVCTLVYDPHLDSLVLPGLSPAEYRLMEFLCQGK